MSDASMRSSPAASTMTVTSRPAADCVFRGAGAGNKRFWIDRFVSGSGISPAVRSSDELFVPPEADR
jgi:hypothetical protein